MHATSLLVSIPSDVLAGRKKSPPPSQKKPLETCSIQFFPEERKASEERCKALDQRIAQLRAELSKMTMGEASPERPQASSKGAKKPPVIRRSSEERCEELDQKIEALARELREQR